MNETSNTNEILQLWAAGKLPASFRKEFIGWVKPYMDRRYVTWNWSDVAREIGVHKMQVQRWIKGTVPDPESCIRIAQRLGLHEDFALNAAGHPTFSSLKTYAEQYRFKWGDGQFIFSALSHIDDRRWHISRSFWKVLAQDLLERWRPSMQEDEVHELALRIAALIDAWARDSNREQPLNQRISAMVIPA